jgi:hypothetical protein
MASSSAQMPVAGFLDTSFGKPVRQFRFRSLYLTCNSSLKRYILHKSRQGSGYFQGFWYLLSVFSISGLDDTHTHPTVHFLVLIVTADTASTIYITYEGLVMSWGSPDSGSHPSLSPINILGNLPPLFSGIRKSCPDSAGEL